MTEYDDDCCSCTGESVFAPQCSPVKCNDDEDDDYDHKGNNDDDDYDHEDNNDDDDDYDEDDDNYDEDDDYNNDLHWMLYLFVLSVFILVV